jgi:alanine racemase
MDYVMAFAGEDKPAVGAWVDLLGGSGPDAWDLARLHGTIPYEILTGIQKRVQREYERDGGLASAPDTPFSEDE